MVENLIHGFAGSEL